MEAERESIAGAGDARRNELRQLIEWRELVLNDDDELDAVFEEYIAALPETERPGTRAQESRMFGEWEDNLQSELDVWKAELSGLEKRAVDKQAIFSSARNKAVHLLHSAAEGAELLPDQPLNAEVTIVENHLQPTSSKPIRMYIHSQPNGVLVECDVYSANRIVVLAESMITKKQVIKSEMGYRKQKEGLIAEGTLADAGHVYRFTKNHEFSSASAVHVIAMSYGTNARQRLQDANGVPFDEYYPK